MLRRNTIAARRRPILGSCRRPVLEWLEARQLLSNGLAEYPITTQASDPLSVTTGPDGNIWFTEYAAGKIGKMSPNGTVLAEYSLSSAGPGAHHPYGITTGPDGNLWFTDPVIVNGTTVTAAVGKISTSGVIQEYAVPASSAPHGIAPGPDGDLWFAESGAMRFGRITPGGTITQVSLSASSRPESVTAGPDGMIWATESGTNRIAQGVPLDPRHHRVRHSDSQQRAVGNHHWNRREPLLHRVERRQARSDHDQRTGQGIFPDQLGKPPGGSRCRHFREYLDCGVRLQPGR